MWPAIPLNTVIILSLCELSFLVDFNNAQPDPRLAAGEIESSTETDEPECSLSNIRQMLGHDDFSLLGISANCLIFFVTGDEIAEGHFDLSRITDKPGKCKDPKPIFYKQDNEYKILVAQKKSVYTSGCKWEEHQSYHSCKFSRSAWMKKSVAPDGDVDEIIGHVTDLNTDILHILYTNEEASMFDAMYNISSQNFVATAKIDEASFKISSFDSDLMRIYYEADKLGYENVQSDRGIFTYDADHKQLLHFNESDFTHFSFSNQYYVVKKKYRTNQELYYFGNEENAEEVCISNTRSAAALKLQLFVGTDPGIETAHSRLIAQISPKKTTTNVQTTTTTPSSALLSSSVNLKLMATSVFSSLFLMCLFTLRAR